MSAESSKIVRGRMASIQTRPAAATTSVAGARWSGTTVEGDDAPPAGAHPNDPSATLAVAARTNAPAPCRRCRTPSLVGFVVPIVPAGDGEVAAAIYELAQLFADLEEGEPLGRDLDRRPRPGVPAGVWLVRAHREAPE